MSDDLLRKATVMRNAIDMIEGALMGLGDFVDLPDLFEGTAEHVHIAPKMTVGEMRRVCTALAECTRIINSDEFAPDQLRRHAQGAPSNFSPGDPVEVRKQNDEIDEIVIRRGDVHIEQMSSDGWFMGVNGADGSYWQFWFGSKNRKSHVEFRHTETVSAVTSTERPEEAT
jgi:hypothetical protein